MRGVALLATSLVVLLSLLGTGAAVSVAHPPGTSGAGPSPLPPIPLPAAGTNTWVVLVHGFDPEVDPVAFWYYGVDIYQQLVNSGYHVAVVSYYGTFTLALSTGTVYTDTSFFGTTNTPIEIVADELARSMKTVLGSQPYTLDLVGHSMGGLIVLYMLEHNRFPNVHLENVVFIGSPLGGAPVSQLQAYIRLSGYQASEMISGSPFLSALKYYFPPTKAFYSQTEWLVYAGDADPSWGWAVFHGPNDGLVSVLSDTTLGYNHLYFFPDLHMPFLDVYDPGHVSYGEDEHVALKLLANFAGQY